MGPFDFGILNPGRIKDSWNNYFENLGANAVRKTWGGTSPTQNVINAAQRAGISPEEEAKLLQGIDYSKMIQKPQTQMSSGRANAYVNPQATAQVAQGINSGYSLLKSPTQPQGDWLSQVGGFFQDRPALTQGLLTTGLGLAAGLSGANAFTTGGAAMQERQTTMSAAEQKAYDRLTKGQEFELNTIKTQADLLKAINEGAGTDNTGYSKALTEAKSLGLEGAEAQRYAMFKQAGITPPVEKRGRGLLGFGVLGGPIGLGKEYYRVAK